MRYPRVLTRLFNSISNFSSRTIIRFLDLNYLALRLVFKPNSRSGRILRQIVNSFRDTLRYTSSPLGAPHYLERLRTEIDRTNDPYFADDMSMDAMGESDENAVLMQRGKGLKYSAVGDTDYGAFEDDDEEIHTLVDDDDDVFATKDEYQITSENIPHYLRHALPEDVNDPEFRQQAIFNALAYSINRDDEYPDYTPNSRLHLVHAYQRFTQGANFSFKYLWPLGFLSLLSYDFYQLLLDSIDDQPTYGNSMDTLLLGTSSNQDSLSSQMGGDLVLDYRSWLGLIAFFTAPVATGLLNWLRYSYIHLRMPPRLDRLTSDSDRKTLLADLAQLNPWSAVNMELDRAELNLLWNGKLSSDYRQQLLNCISDLANQGGITGARAIHVMANLIYSENRHHFQQYHTVNSNVLGFLDELERLATFRSRQDLLTYLQANKELSSLGKQSATIFNLLFIIPSLIMLAAGGFTAVRLFEMGFFKIERLVDVLRSCPDNRIKSFVARLGDYSCSVCGDWDFVYLNDIFSPQACLDNLLASHLPPAKIIAKLENRIARFSDEIHYIDLSRSDWLSWSITDWDALWDSFEGMGMQRLSKLDLSQSNSKNMSPEDEKIIRVNQFLQNQQIDALHINGAGLADQQVGLVTNGFNTSQPTLSVVSLVDNNIQDNGGTILFDRLAELPALKVVDVSGNFIGDDASPALGYMINATEVANINLSDNNFGATTAKELNLVIADSDISHLDVSHNPIFASVDADSLFSHMTNSSLQSLRAVNTQLTDTVLIALANTIPQANFTELSISENNYLSAEAVVYFMERVANSDIAVLGIANLNFTPEAMALIRRHDFPNIRELDFSDNQMVQQGEGFDDTLAFIGKMPVLTNINLSHNELTDQQTHQLAQVFNQTQIPMQAIVLANNDIQHGSQSFITWLARADKIDLGHNLLSDSFVESLTESLIKSNTSVLILDYAHVNGASLYPLFQHLSETRLQVFSSKGVPLGDNTDELAVNLVRGVPDMIDYGRAHLSLNQRRALTRGVPASHIQKVILENVGLEDEQARLLCRTFTPANISLGDFELTDNPFVEDLVNPENCVVSSGSQLQPIDYEAVLEQPLSWLEQSATTLSTPVTNLLADGEDCADNCNLNNASGNNLQYVMLAAATPANIILALIALYLLLRYIVNLMSSIIDSYGITTAPVNMATHQSQQQLTYTEPVSQSQPSQSGYRLFGWFGRGSMSMLQTTSTSGPNNPQLRTDTSETNEESESSCHEADLQARKMNY